MGLDPASKAPAGLEHVVLGDSSISLVDGEGGGLSYRGYPVDELVRHASYEAVVHLLWRGDPPSPEETRALELGLGERRSVAPEIWELASHLPHGLSPLEGLRTLL
ncbi:MAG TPA: citrate/2-methylcitrate synthase, partial [Thermoplasmata archaeon]|nr:citrate/2-methylcitrate synthase [Thermoplasmata archaeon]